MPTKTFKEDQGTDFGKWEDDVSRFLYFESIEEIFRILKPVGKIADYGGANGILKTILKNCITIDLDKSKSPDICENILTHKGAYDFIMLRYVLHYLNDYEILFFWEHLKTFHKGRILVIQFCNNDLKNKYQNSKNEFKYFRTEVQFEQLLPPESKKIYSKKYTVTAEFYENRLGILNATEHEEVLNA